MYDLSDLVCKMKTELRNALCDLENLIRIARQKQMAEY